MHSSSWDNLRYVLAVIDSGSLSAAARDLGVNHATVLRRIASFEAQYGGTLFEKSVNGYRLLPGKEVLVRAIREVENSVLTVERLMMGANPQLSGVVRISSTDTICQHLLPDVLQTIRSESPELEIEVLCSNLHLNFARMEADIFVRPAASAPADTISEKTCDLVLRAFGTSDNLDKWFGLKGPIANSNAASWLAKNVAEGDITSGADSFLVLSRMAQTGAGIAILPSFVGDNTPGLVHLPDKMPDLSVPVWVGTHQDLTDIPRIRAVKNCVIAHLTDAV